MHTASPEVSPQTHVRLRPLFADTPAPVSTPAIGHFTDSYLPGHPVADIVEQLRSAMDLPSIDAVNHALANSSDPALAALSRRYDISVDLLFEARFSAMAHSATAHQPPSPAFHPVRDRASILAFIRQWRLKPYSHSEHLYTTEFLGAAQPLTLPQILRALRTELDRSKDILPSDHAEILRAIVSETPLRRAYNTRIESLPDYQAHAQGTASFTAVATVLLSSLGARATMPLYADVVAPRRSPSQTLRDAHSVWRGDVHAWGDLRYPIPETILFHAAARLLTPLEFESFDSQPNADPYLQLNLAQIGRAHV